MKTEEKKYKCKTFKLIKKNEEFWTIERNGSTINLYYYDGKELNMYEIPKEDFVQIVMEGTNNEKSNRD